MNVTKTESAQNELHDWIDNEVPQMIEDEIDSQNVEITIDKESLKRIEAEVTKLLKGYFK